MMNSWSPSNRHYSEAEAAAELGLDIEQLRALARRHLLQSDEETACLSQTLFERSDLLLLRLLVQQESTQSAAAAI